MREMELRSQHWEVIDAIADGRADYADAMAVPASASTSS